MKARAAGIATTLGALSLTVEPLRRLLALPLPAAAAYHLAKLASLIQPELQHFHEQRNALIQRYGHPREATANDGAQGLTGQIYQVTDEHLEEFTRAVHELSMVPIVIAWTPFDLAALGNEPITGADLLALGPLVTGGPIT